MEQKKSMIESELTKVDHIQDQIDDMVVELIKLRKKSKLSQIELSKISGVPQTTISRIETFRTTPDIHSLLKLFNAIGFTIKVGKIND